MCNKLILKKILYAFRHRKGKVHPLGIQKTPVGISADQSGSVTGFFFVILFRPSMPMSLYPSTFPFKSLPIYLPSVILSSDALFSEPPTAPPIKRSISNYTPLCFCRWIGGNVIGLAQLQCLFRSGLKVSLCWLWANETGNGCDLSFITQ